MFLPLLIFSLVISLVFVLLGTAVFLRNPRLQLNRALFALSLSSSVWVISNTIATATEVNLQQSLLANKITFLFSLLTSFILLAFILYFTKIKNTRFWQVLITTNVVGMCFSISSWVVNDVNFVKGLSEIDFGILAPLYFLLVAFNLFFAVTTLLVKRRGLRGVELSRSNVILASFFAGTLFVVITNLVLPFMFGNYQMTGMGPVSILFLIGGLAYSITTHKLFDLKTLVVRSLAYVFSVGTLALAYSIISFGIVSSILLEGVTDNTQRMVYTLLAVLLALTFQPFKKFFDRWTNKLFYQDAYEAQELLDELNHILVSTIELNKMLKASADVIGRNIKSEFCVFGLRETDFAKQRIIGETERKFDKADIDFAKKVTPKIDHKVIVADHLEEDSKELQRKMRKNDIAILVRLTSDVSEEGIGYIVLGTKKSGNPYNSQDVRVLETIANSMVIAIDNALRFEEIEKFNITLEQKVEDATRKLERTNAKLVALDETKDDFISMASHQLRTPLTSVKGYLSMVLEGDAGNLNPKQEKLLDQAFISSQRMVYLIADLLNVSRLRTGKFVIETKETNLAEVVAGEVEQLTETAEARGLKLTYDKPKNFPILMLDETKIRQVIMNFTDNAIYYTPDGGHIKVQLEETPQSVQFTVTDNGIGVPKHEQHHLFGKFFRAGNARKARPDGTGLGLFMAKKVVIAQGGSIVFRSHEGKGSTFGFTFAKAHLLPPKAKG